MTICMSDIFCVTNRSLCKEDFLARIEKIAQANPSGIILREKNLSERDYKALAENVLSICKAYDTKIIIHSYYNAAKELGCRSLHMPLPLLREMSDRGYFTMLGASCHSIEEAKEAERLDCSYIVAGHIFDTDCKKDLPGRGLEFLKNICDSVSIPVFAIGGIGKNNISDVLKSGAKGACVMSSAMLCENPSEYLHQLMR